MSNLTRRQQETLEAIVDYQKRMGFPPTVLELAGLIGVSSPNAAACHVNALKRKGGYLGGTRCSAGHNCAE